MKREKALQKPENNYKWYLLTLVVLTNLFVVAMPTMGLSVLSKEISQDLGLNLVQVGVVWGASALPSILTNLIGGALGDRFGPKRMLVISSLLAGLLGAARGLALDFFSLTVAAILFGSLMPFVSMNGVKTAGQWFPPHQLGLANGLISMGMALGFLLGSLFSATTLSPLLGGWRNVLMLYGLIGALFSLPWYFTQTLPQPQPADGEQKASIFTAIRQVVRLRNIWLLGLMLFGVGGGVQGLLGYLPLYLRNLGWEAVYADGALTAFHTASMIFVMPIALWSDRVRSRKHLLLGALSLVVAGAGLLSGARGDWIWCAVLLAGSVRDAFMAIYMTMVIETEGVGSAYIGTALGLTAALGGLGNFIAPPLGNSLAGWWPGAPFAFWGGLAALGMVCVTQVRERFAKPAVLPAASPAGGQTL